MVRACITITVDQNRRRDAIDALRSIAGPTRAEPGCLDCCLYGDADDDCRLCLVEEWSTLATFRERLRSRSYMNVLLVMEMSVVPPRVQFDVVSSRRGIEVVHEERDSVK